MKSSSTRRINRGPAVTLARLTTSPNGGANDVVEIPAEFVGAETELNILVQHTRPTGTSRYRGIFPRRFPRKLVRANPRSGRDPKSQLVHLTPTGAAQP